MTEIPAEVYELADEPDKVYIFGFPEDADQESVTNIAQEISSKFDHAKILLFAGEIQADMLVDEVTFVVEAHPKENGEADDEA